MKLKLLALALSLCASHAFAEVKITDPWIRGTLPAMKATGAFMNVSSTVDTRLIDATAPGIRVEIHEMTMQDNVMRMRQISGLDVPAGKTVELKPGSYHLMFFDLQNQLKEGDKVPLTLTFENSDKKKEIVRVTAPVKALDSKSAEPKAHSGHPGH